MLFPPPLSVRGVGDDEKATNGTHAAKAHAKKSKGESSEGSKTARKKKAKPKPKAARKKKKTPAPEAAPHRKPQPTPEPTPVPEGTPKPEAAHPSPSPSPSPAATSSSAAVVVQKSGEAEQEEPTPTPEPRHWSWWLFGGGTHYRYLSQSIRNAIDRAPVARHRWRYIVVHNSGTRQGNAKAFDYYHLHVRKMPNGLAYHFVIGNGTSSGNGAVEIGGRWVRQINGGHVHSDYLNNIALGICLVGDFNHGKPTQQQLDALDELIGYLRNRVGKTEHKAATVKAHKDINPPQWPTDCPGDKFPYRWLYSRFD